MDTQYSALCFVWHYCLEFKKVPKWVPIELLLMLLTIFISWVALLDKVIKTVGNVPSGLPPFTVPDLTLFPASAVLVH